MAGRFHGKPSSPTKMNVVVSLAPGGERVKCGVILAGADTAASSDVITEDDVALVVKCSGDRNEPRPTIYGSNNNPRRRGCKLPVIRFPVGYFGYCSHHVDSLVSEMRYAWRQDGRVLFH